MKDKYEFYRSHYIIWEEIKEQKPFCWAAVESFIEEFRYHHTLCPDFKINLMGHPVHKLHLIYEDTDDGFLSHNDLLYMFDEHGISANFGQMGARDKWYYRISNWNDETTHRSELNYSERWEAEIAAINVCFDLLEKKLKSQNLHILN